MRETFVCVSRDRDLFAGTFGHFLLYAFFIWASFYTPAYLHNVLGIPWSDLGWMFAVMLIPYAVIEYPAGWLADRFFGDKEMMSVGFMIAGGALASISLLTPTSPLFLILLILVATRTGAALVESMTEGHFFRRVSERDVNSIGIFRAMWPLANLIAPIIGSGILFFGNYETLFIVTGGFIALAGVGTTLYITDFRPMQRTPIQETG